MKLKFFVEAVNYNPDNPKPSVIIHLTNKINITPNKVHLITSSDNLKEKIIDTLKEDLQVYHTRIMLDFSKYKESKISVGDILEADISICNKGEITI